MSSALLILSMLAAGALLARTGVLRDSAADAINRFVVNVSLPAVVLHLVPGLRWQPELFILPLAPWLTLVIGASVVALAGKALCWPRPVLGAVLLCAPLGNTSFLGLPMVKALRGEQGMHYALLYDQLGSFLALATYGLVVLALFSGDTKPSLATIARRISLFPPFIALLIALSPLPIPTWLDTALALVGETLTPLAMLAVGMRLKLRPPEHRSALAVGLAVKMALIPACTFALVRALGTPDLPADVAVIEAAMPPMLSAAAMASMAGLAPELCAALAGYGLVIAFALVPLLAAVI